MSENDWIEVLDSPEVILSKKEKLRCTSFWNGEDLGEVLEVRKNHIVTQKGILNKKRYYLPKKAISNFDGTILKVNMTNNDLDQYRGNGDQLFDDYSSFKSSDMSKELETKIPVMAENLEVTKRLTEDNVKIIKEPIKEIRKIDIELTHEEITIERIPSNNDNSSSSLSPPNEDPNKSKTELIIKLKREEPVIEKYSFVKEEVVIRKKPITETKTIIDVIVNKHINL